MPPLPLIGMSRANPGLGVDFIRCLDTTISLVQRSPQLFRNRHGEIRLAMIPRFPFAVYFIWDEAAGFASICRILHFAQNAPAHPDR
jgi:plasmid stabilization system protein ParE